MQGRERILVRLRRAPALCILATIHVSAIPAAVRSQLGPPQRMSVARRASAKTITASAQADVVAGGIATDLADELDHRNGFLTATLLRSGGLAVADNYRVRFYDSGGRLVRTIGAHGRGPGEIGGLAAICALAGDTVAAYDFQLQRVSIVSAAGGMIRQFETERARTAPALLCDDGGTVIGPSVRTGAAPNGWLVRMTSEGRELSRLVQVPPRAASGALRLSVAGGYVWVGDPGSPTLRGFDKSGRLTRTLELAEPRRAMTPAEAARFGPVAAGSASSAKRLQNESATAYWPLYQAIVGDDLGELWLQNPREPGDPGRGWVCLRVDGALCGKIALPGDGDGEPPIIIGAMRASLWLLVRTTDGAAQFERHRLATPR